MAAAKKTERVKPTYHFAVRINGGDPIDFDDMTPERRAEIKEKLADRFAASLGYYPVEE